MKYGEGDGKPKAPQTLIFQLLQQQHYPSWGYCLALSQTDLRIDHIDAIPTVDAPHFNNVVESRSNSDVPSALEVAR